MKILKIILINNTHYEIILYSDSIDDFGRKDQTYIEINDINLPKLVGDISNTMIDFELKNFNLNNIEKIIKELDNDILDLYDTTKEFIKIMKLILNEFKLKYKHLIDASKFDLI